MQNINTGEPVIASNMNRVDAWAASDRLAPNEVKQLLKLYRVGCAVDLDPDSDQHERLMADLELIKALSSQKQWHIPAWARDKQKVAAHVQEAVHLLAQPPKSTPESTDGLQNSSLASIPPEMREAIFAEVLPHAERFEYLPTPVNFDHGTDPVAPLRTCKQIRQEAAKLFYGRNDLVFVPRERYNPSRRGIEPATPRPPRQPQPRYMGVRRTSSKPLELDSYGFHHFGKAISPLVSRCIRSIVVYHAGPDALTAESLDQLVALQTAHPTWIISYGYPALDPSLWYRWVPEDGIPGDYPAKMTINDPRQSIAEAKCRIDEIALETKPSDEAWWRSRFSVVKLESTVNAYLQQRQASTDES